MIRCKAATYFLLVSASVFAQSVNNKTVTPEPVVFKIRVQPRSTISSVFMPQQNTLNQLFANYNLTFRPTKNDPPNIQELLNCTVLTGTISCAVKGIIKDFSIPGIFAIRALPPGARIFFEKVSLVAADGRTFYVKSIFTVKRR